MASFLFLVFALTWMFQIPWIASTEGWLPFEFPFPLLFVMGWMPGLAAIIVTGATSGRAGVRSLLGRILIWRVGFKWYLFPIFGSAALWTAALALDLWRNALLETSSPRAAVSAAAGRASRSDCARRRQCPGRGGCPGRSAR